MATEDREAAARKEEITQAGSHVPRASIPRTFWVDLANSPHVVFFRPIVEQLRAAGHKVLLTARDFAQTRGLVDRWGIEARVVGGHGGRHRALKLLNLMSRAWKLRRAVASSHVDAAISHNSYSQILAARSLRVWTVTLMDYEHTPANHLAFRLANRVIVPAAWDEREPARFGAGPSKVRRYEGLKEEVYLGGFRPDPRAREEIESLIGSPLDRKLLVTVRPPATEAIYHRFENPHFARVLEHLAGRTDVAVVILPRTPAQRQELSERRPPNFHVPERPLDGPNLLYCSDAIVGAGGTMNREAAVLGTKAYTLFAGRIGAVDRWLIGQGRMVDLRAAMDGGVEPAAALAKCLAIEKRPKEAVPASSRALAQVIRWILEGVEERCPSSPASRPT